MKMKMENPNKIKNIVEGNYVQLGELYMPFLGAIQEQQEDIRPLYLTSEDQNEI